MGLAVTNFPLANLEGKILIVPVVSTANVGQLAVDLLIASMSLVRIAVLDPKFCVPVVGARDDGQKGITTPLERKPMDINAVQDNNLRKVYGSLDSNLVVIQQRSPVLKSLKEEFIRELLTFIKDAKFSSTLFLSGVDLSNRTDAQMTTPTYQLRPENGPTLAGTSLKSLSSLPIPTYYSPVRQHLQPEEENQSIPFIPGGGLTRRILSSIPNGWAIPTACLLQFVLEGDNRADAGLLASVVTKVVGADVKQWKQPFSWRAGLFGTPHDQTLYG